MLKPLLHTILIFALFFQQLQMVVVYAVFKVQQSYLSKNVCINRTDPNSKCHAHCQLSKRINEQDEQENESKIPLKEQTEFVARFEKTTLKNFQPGIPKLDFKKQPDEKLLCGFHCEPFQPPES